MNILRPVDIEEECRLALIDYLAAYVRPLPEDYALPHTEITCTGGGSENTIDRFTVVLDARAETDAEASEQLRTTIGILEKQAQDQFGALRNVEVNAQGNWGSDPVRPDLKLARATVIVTAHREHFTIPES